MVSTQTVQQVWINHDHDLLDVTLVRHPPVAQTKPQRTAVVSHGSQAPPAQVEVVHTTQKHPWLTTQGWVTAGGLQIGSEVQLLEGGTATVVGLRVVEGTASMYDLTVSEVHTFAVGDGQFIVHNCSSFDDLTRNLDKTKPVTLIGRDMKDRVIPASEELKAAGFEVNIWKPRGTPTSWMKANRSWLRYWVVEKRSQIVDIGDHTVGNPFEESSSSYLNMERRSVRRWGGILSHWAYHL